MVESDDVKDGVTKKYETFAFFIFQSFFDHISADIIPPLLENLDYFTFGPIKKDDVPILDDELNISFELDNFKISKASVDPSPSGVVLSDDINGITVGFQNLTFSIQGDYSYITDPPIFADIGTANIYFANTTFHTDVKSEIIRLAEGHDLELIFSN